MFAWIVSFGTDYAEAKLGPVWICGSTDKGHSRDKRGADTYLIPYVLLHRLACVRCVLELIDAAHGRISVGLFSARSDKPLDARTERYG